MVRPSREGGLQEPSRKPDPAYVEHVVRVTMYLIITLLAILALGLIVIFLGWLVQTFWV